MGHKHIDFNSIEFKSKMDDEEQHLFRQILSGKKTTKVIGLLKKHFR